MTHERVCVSHVAGAEAVAAVAFPRIVEGVFLVADIAAAAGDVENRCVHSELRRRARIAARAL